MEELYQTPNWKSFAIIPKVLGSISLVASFFIMRDVFLKKRRKQSVPFTSVLMFFLSASDSLRAFFATFLSTWMAPRDSGVFLAAGNTQTCSAQGFITVFTLVSSVTLYAELMALYWLLVCRGWTEEKLKQTKVRIIFFLPPTILSLGLSAPPLFYGMYNFGGVFACFFQTLPIGCEDDPQVNCVRGEDMTSYRIPLFIYFGICNLMVICAVTMLVYKVFRQERNMDTYLLPGLERRRTNTIKTAWQGIRYVGAYTAGYILFYIYLIYETTTYEPSISLLYACVIITPLQGFFNAFVYFRPRYIAYKECNPDKKRIERINAVFNLDLDLLSSFSSIHVGPSGSKLQGSLQGNAVANAQDDGDLSSPLILEDSCKTKTLI